MKKGKERKGKKRTVKKGKERFKLYKHTKDKEKDIKRKRSERKSKA